MTRPLPVESCGPEAAQALSDLHVKCFSPPDAWSAADIGGLMALPGCRGWIVQEAQGLIGMLLVRQAADEAEILTLCVLPSRRKQGVARTLLLTMIENLRIAGVCKIFLEVRCGNLSAQRVYEGLDFRNCGVRVNYYKDGGNALLMRRLLSSSHENKSPKA